MNNPVIDRQKTRLDIVELQIKQMRENFSILAMEVKRLGFKMGNFFEEHRHCGNFTNKNESYDE